MTNKIALTIVALGLTLPAISLNAQDDPRPPRGPRGGGPGPGSPLVASLDLNHDGTIDQSELNAAPQSLKTLDKNGDGKLTPEELRPGRGPARDEADDATKVANPPNGPGRRGGPPIVAALDANKDGVIDATEISGATAALKTLDKNSDGQLTMDEIGPRGPRGGGGPGGPGEGGRQRRPQPADAQ